MKKLLSLLLILSFVSCGSSKSMTDISVHHDEPSDPTPTPVEPIDPVDPVDPDPVGNVKTIVAVVDSGVDIDHPKLSKQIYKNDFEIGGTPGVDDDGNGFVDDFNGWNFSTESDPVGNNLVFDPAFRNQLTPDVYKMSEYFSMFDEYVYNAVPMHPDMASWYTDMFHNHNDELQNLVDDLDDYSGYAHGTHVAGIVARYENNTILPIKLLASYVNFRASAYDDAISSINLQVAGEKEFFGKYMGAASVMNARVVNASFGYDYGSAVDFYLQNFDEDVANDLALKEINGLNKADGEVMQNLNHMLFVIAAGNEGVDIEVEPDNPSGANADNKLVVGATYEHSKIASFSNFGAVTVDVFAPGVNILSTIPSFDGHDQMAMSGTSQAAPYVARLAGHIFSINPALGPLDVKQIIRDTVDVKDWLAGKCSTSGIVNDRRALKAAELSLVDGVTLDEAISEAKNTVSDIRGRAIYRKRFSLLRDEFNPDLDLRSHFVKRPSRFIKIVK